MITCYTVPEIWRVTDVIVIFHFVLFFYPNSPKNQNFMKMKKTPENIIIFHICSKNYDQMMYSSWDMVHDRWTDRWMDKWTDRRMDEWMEKVTYRGGWHTQKYTWHQKSSKNRHFPSEICIFNNIFGFLMKFYLKKV